MIRPRDRDLHEDLRDCLAGYERAHGPLPGLAAPGAHESFLEQVVESVRRKRYLEHVGSTVIGDASADPDSPDFDPMRAAVWHHVRDETDDAFWNLFLFAHFGRHPKGRYRYARGVAGALGHGDPWDWGHVSADPVGFRRWLADNRAELGDRTAPGGFGNHRKYESLGAWNDAGTGAVVASYVEWVGDERSHEVRLRTSEPVADPEVRFDELYRDMADVHRFGRTARLDYLSTAGHLGLLDVRPGRLYIPGSTGPLTGARIMFPAVAGGPTRQRIALDFLASGLADDLGVGKDTMEDALCNWQKSPDLFVAYRG